MNEILVLLVALVAFIIAFLPSIIASNTDHQNVVAIIVCNIIGLFTGVFWLVALIWSFTGISKSPRV